MTIDHLLTRRSVVWLALALIAAVLAFFAVRAAFSNEEASREFGIVEGDSAIVATVNGAPVEYGWIRRQVATHGQALVVSRMDPNDWRRLVVINVLRDSAAHAEALRRGYEPDMESIDAFVAQQRAACESHIEERQGGLAAFGMTVDEHYENMRSVLPRENLIRQLRDAVAAETFPAGASPDVEGANWNEFLDQLLAAADVEWNNAALQQDFRTGWPTRAVLRDALTQAHAAQSQEHLQEPFDGLLR